MIVELEKIAVDSFSNHKFHSLKKHCNGDINWCPPFSFPVQDISVLALTLHHKKHGCQSTQS